MRPRVHADKLHRPAVESGLLPKLPDERLFDGLPKLNKATGKGPVAAERGSTPSYEEDPPRPDPDGVGRERRILVAGGHPMGEDLALLGVVRDEWAASDRSRAQDGSRSVRSGDKH